MRQRRPRPSRQHGCHPFALQSDSSVPEREDPAMQGNQSSRTHAISYQTTAKAHLEQLPTRNHTMLCLRKLANQPRRMLAGPQRITLCMRCLRNMMRCRASLHKQRP